MENGLPRLRLAVTETGFSILKSGRKYSTPAAVLNVPRQIFRPEAAPMCRGALESRGSGILHFQGICICGKKQRQYACVLTMFLEAYTNAFS
ncbi:MAG: hypothetical protein LBR60_06295, partial [Fibrobacter sp.]|nr:hypothetical protein [Fibrobacter sp.]